MKLNQLNSLNLLGSSKGGGGSIVDNVTPLPPLYNKPVVVSVAAQPGDVVTTFTPQPAPESGLPLTMELTNNPTELFALEEAELEAYRLTVSEGTWVDPDGPNPQPATTPRPTNSTWRASYYDPRGFFFIGAQAIGTAGQGQQYSEDGLVWTANGFETIGSNLRNCVYNPFDGKAYAASGANVYSSSDPRIDNFVSESSIGNYVTHVAVTKTGTVLAFRQFSSTLYINHKPLNGSWSLLKTYNSIFVSGDITNRYWYDEETDECLIGHQNGTVVYVADCSSASGTATRTDITGSTATGSVFGLAKLNNVWWAQVYRDTTLPSVFYTSPDGVIWTQAGSFPADQGWATECIRVNNRIYAVVRNLVETRGDVFYSEDLVNWALYANLYTGIDHDSRRPAYDQTNGKLIICSYGNENSLPMTWRVDVAALVPPSFTVGETYPITVTTTETGGKTHTEPVTITGVS